MAGRGSRPEEHSERIASEHRKAGPPITLVIKENYESEYIM